MIMKSIDDQNSVLAVLLQLQLGWTLPAPVGSDCVLIVCNDLDDKQRCIYTRQLLPQLGRPLLAPVGPLLPIWARRGPISVPPHLQLGGTLVP